MTENSKFQDLWFRAYKLRAQTFDLYINTLILDHRTKQFATFSYPFCGYLMHRKVNLEVGT